MNGAMMGGPPLAGATASGGGSGKTMDYFMDMAEAEKHIKHCSAEIDFNNSQGAINFILKTIELFKKHAGPMGKSAQFPPYQPKGNM